jgi:hypothetical protein
MNTTLKLLALIFALLLFYASAGIAGEPGKELPLPVNIRQELDGTMQWLKSAIESISITLIPVDLDDGNQYYSHYSFSNEGCSVKFSYDFNYYQRMKKERKTTRIDSSFNLKDIPAPEVAPFYLTHIQTQLYSVHGNSFLIPVNNTGFAEQIAKKLDQARRLCGATR